MRQGMSDSELGRAVLHAFSEGELEELCAQIVNDCGEDVDWGALISEMCVLEDAGATDALAKLAFAARGSLQQRALAMALVRLDTSACAIKCIWRALVAGVFSDAIASMTKSDMEECVGEPNALALEIHTIYFGGKIERYLNQRDFKRAFDFFVMAVRTYKNMDDRGVPYFDAVVRRIWTAYKEAGLVEEMTSELTDWRNITANRVIFCGKERRAERSGMTPYIERMVVRVPMAWLWGPYVVVERKNWMDDDAFADKVSFANGANEEWMDQPLRVEAPGNMLRDVIWAEHVRSKKKNLRNFCKRKGLAVPDWANT